MTSRDTGRWVIPKGWPMTRKCAHEVAMQEAFEEAGVRGVVETETLGAYTYSKVLRDGVQVICKVQVYALEATDMAKNFKEKASAGSNGFHSTKRPGACVNRSSATFSSPSSKGWATGLRPRRRSKFQK